MMGNVANLRGSRTGTTHENLLVSDGVSQVSKKKWSRYMPLYVALVVIAEIALLGRLDMAHKTAIMDTLSDLFYQSSPSNQIVLGRRGDIGMPMRVSDLETKFSSCEEWLMREDDVVYSRDFETNPILVTGGEKDWKDCAVGCKFGESQFKTNDATFGLQQQPGTANVLRSMESSHYYPENNIDQARRWSVQDRFGSSYTPRLKVNPNLSNVPVGYFSWAEYDIMAPVKPKTEKALAAAFISNCGARNFRLQALEALENTSIKIDSYGGCHRNRNGNVNKLNALKGYKFSLAFENSNEEDYVTEKFFQSLVAGTIPVVVGAPNIQDFAPCPDSVLHIKELEDAVSVAKTMNYLAENAEAYNHSLRWKYEGPSDSFKALMDMAAVHSSCRLCIHLATVIRAEEENKPEIKNRPCKCTEGLATVYHLYVRERGRFKMESIFLRSGELTLKLLETAVLEKFKSMKHVPIWKEERPESIRGGDDFKVYRIYPVGLTQREALYTFSFNGDDDLESHIVSNACSKFEVIFV